MTITASNFVDREPGKNKNIELLNRESSLQHLLKAVKNIHRKSFIPYKMVYIYF